MFGVILIGFGFYDIADMIRENNLLLSNLILITGFIGCVGWLLCVQAVIYKRINNNGKDNYDIADNTLEGFYKAIYPPFFLSYIVLMSTDMCIMIAVLNDSLGVPKLMALLNSIVFLIIGVLFRKINSNKFQDLPGIIMPSLGLAMIGVIGIVAYLI